MRIFDIALNDLKVSSRNRVSFAMILILPLVMIFVMGFALKSVFQLSNGIDRFEVLYVNEDKGVMGKTFDSFIKDQGSKFINPVSVSRDTANQEVSSGKYPVAVIVPEDMSERISNNEKVSVEIISSGKDQVKESVVKSLLDAFSKTMSTQVGVSRVYSEYVKSSTGTEGGLKLSEIHTNYGGSFIKNADADVPVSKKLSSYQYFSASMLLFFMFTAGMGIGTAILAERAEKLYSRVHSFPVSEFDYLGGKVIGNLLISVIQVLTVVVFTRFVFGVSWGQNPLGVGVTILLVVLISCSLGIIFSSIMDSPKTMSSSMTVVLWILTFISGGFSPIPGLEGIGKLTFYRWGLDSITNFMAGGSFLEASGNLMMLSALAVILWGAGIFLYRRRFINE
jgi:ABC-2 type transporter.